MGDQAGEAGVEHHRDDHGGHRGDRSQQRGPHRDRLPAPPRLEGQPDALDRGCGQPGRRGLPGDHRRTAGGRGLRSPHRADGQDGEQPEQQDGEQGDAGAEHQPVGLNPAAGVEPPHRADRGQRGHGHGARHGQDQGAEDADQPGQARGHRGLGPGSAERPDHRDVRRDPAQHLSQPLADQHEQGQRGGQAKDGQRGRVRPDGLLDLVVNDVREADRERQVRHVLMGGLADLPLQGGGQLGQLPLQARDPGRAVGQAQPHPGVAEPAQHLAGGAGGQSAALGLIGLIDQGRRDLGDRGHPVGVSERPPGGLSVRAHMAEGVRDVPAHPGAEHPGDGRGEHDLGGRVEPGQPPGQDGHPVLGEPLAVQAAVHTVGEEGVVDMAVDHGILEHADVRGVGHDARQ